MQQLQLFGCLLAIVATFVPLQGVSVSRFGDVEIYVNETYWKCDKIDCPIETTSCKVIKKKLQPDATELQRIDTCYGPNNAVLKENISTEQIGANENISLDVVSTRFGVSSTSSNTGGAAFYTGNNYNYNYATTSGDGAQIDEKELENTLSEINRVNEENIRQINEQVERNLENLRKQLESTFGNLFGSRRR